MLTNLIDGVKSKLQSLLTTHKYHSRYYITSHSNLEVEDRNGTAGLHVDLGEFQAWYLVRAGGDGMYYSVSHRRQKFEDHNGVLGLHNDWGAYQTRRMANAGDGEYFIVSHRGQKLED